MIRDFLKRLFESRGSKRKRKAVEGFSRSLHDEAIEIANKELEKEMKFGEYLDEVLERVRRGDDLTEEEAEKFNLLRIEKQG